MAAARAMVVSMAAATRSEKITTALIVVGAGQFDIADSWTSIWAFALW